MSKIIKVFIGNDKDRARLILQELEDTTDVVWEHNGTRPLFIFQGWTDPIWIYFKKGKLESRWFSHSGIEVTPREFIESIQKEKPKNREIKKTTEDIGYSVFIGGDNDKLKYILNKLKTETNIKWLSDDKIDDYFPNRECKYLNFTKNGLGHSEGKYDAIDLDTYDFIQKAKNWFPKTKGGNKMKIYAKEEKLLHEKKHNDDAGVDLSCSKNTIARAFEVTKIATGVSVELENAWGLVTGRSSLNAKGLIVANGIIDEGYRGEIYVTIYNTTAQDIEFKKGERIAQIIPMPYVKEVKYEIGEAPKDTHRADKGFGSSGK